MWPWRRRSDEDFAEEIQEHIRRERKRLVDEEGLNFADAKAKALRSFGNVTATHERFYEVRRIHWVDDVWRDVRYALRGAQRNPMFAVAALLTLALGIGANGAIFSVINAVMIRPLRYPEPHQLVRLAEITPPAATPDARERRSGAVSVAELIELRSRSKTLSQVSFSGGPSIMIFSDHGESRRLQGQRVAPNVFNTLGVPALLGRTFDRSEEQPGMDVSVVLSHTAWVRHFNAHTSVIGQRWTLTDTLFQKPEPRQFTIIGVMPAGFVYPDRQIEFWIPVAWRPNSRGALIARVADGLSATAARDEVATILRDLRKSKPEVRYELVPASQSDAVERVKPALIVLMGAAGFVLLIAAANVGNLLFAKAIAHQREITVRIALGAGRARLIRHLITESVVLAVLGAVVGVLIAFGGVQLLKWLATTLPRMDLGVQLAFPRLDDVRVDGFVLLFIFLSSLVTGVLLGLPPALRLSRPKQMVALRETASTYSGLRNRLGAWLVATEIALSVMLLVGAGLLLQSFINLSQVDLGYDPTKVLTFQVALPPTRYPNATLKSFADDLTARLQSLPGVEAAAYGQPPLVAITEGAYFRRTPEIVKGARPGFERRLVSRNYLAVMRIPIIAGRTFSNRDRAGSPRVLLINQSLAQQEFPRDNPVGRYVYAGADSQAWEIVGVVADVRQGGLDEAPNPQWFVLYDQWPGDAPFVLGPYFAIRTRSDPLSVLADVRGLVRQVDAEAGLFNVAPMVQLVSNRLSQPRLYAVFLATFAAIAVVLAGIGVFGVVSYAVTKRTREIGIRTALGAQRSQVLALVMRHTVAASAIGLVAGLVGAAALTRYLESLLFGVTPHEPSTYALVAVFFLAIAILASLVPASRAARINPLTALRYE
jgi:putative ABC transport system permease protein